MRYPVFSSVLFCPRKRLINRHHEDFSPFLLAFSRDLVYICDTSDKHQAARDRKFKIWFKRYASLDDLVFVSEVMDVEDDSYFASMILSRRTTDLYQIQTTFHDYFQDLRSKLE